MSLYVKKMCFNDLNEDQKIGLPNNGSGKELATYFGVYHNGELVDIHSDAMEPEDARFYRDLEWVAYAIEDAYKRGVADVQYGR